MQSMTGFGRGVASGDCGTLSVDITAVNSRKQVDLRCSVPKELGMLEQQIRLSVQKALSRGSLNLTVTYQLAPQFLQNVQLIDHAAFEAAAVELTGLAEKWSLDNPKVGDVLKIPGVIASSQSNPYEQFRTLLEPALAEALAALRESRIQEGLKLKADLVARGRTVEGLLEKIEGRGDEALLQLKARLKARLEELGAALAQDDERLARELVFFAERADITEELVRLKSHVQKYYRLLEEEEPGRALDFLGQEMNREATTLSSKTSDLCISEYALSLKIEISKIREQIMNIE